MAPITRNVERLTKSPKIAETAIATTDAHVYSYLQTDTIVGYFFLDVDSLVCYFQPSFPSNIQLGLFPKRVSLSLVQCLLDLPER